MAETHEHSTSTDDIEFSFDRETLGALLVRHPWAVRFLAFEAILLSITGLIPFLGESSMKYVLFGMLLSIGLLAAIVAAAVGLAVIGKSALQEFRNRVARARRT